MTDDMTKQAIKGIAEDLKKQDPARVALLMDDLESTKTERLSLRVTPAERAMIQAAARRRRQSLSGYVLTAVEYLEQ